MTPAFGDRPLTGYLEPVGQQPLETEFGSCGRAWGRGRSNWGGAGRWGGGRRWGRCNHRGVRTMPLLALLPGGGASAFASAATPVLRRAASRRRVAAWTGRRASLWCRGGPMRRIRRWPQRLPRQADIGLQRWWLGCAHQSRGDLDDRHASDDRGAQTPGTLPSDPPPHASLMRCAAAPLPCRNDCGRSNPDILGDRSWLPNHANTSWS
jgi:hypothetical protein